MSDAPNPTWGNLGWNSQSSDGGEQHLADGGVTSPASSGAVTSVNGLTGAVSLVAAHQANSVATTGAGVATDLNALIAKLIAAGLMAAS